MRLPRPFEDEDFNSFLTRFIADFYAILEFENLDQRMEIAKTIYDTHG